MSMTDNKYNYQHIDNTYVTGNVVKVASISLPAFIKETNPLSIKEKSKVRPSALPFSAPEVPAGSTFKVPLPVHINRILQVGLIVLSGLAILAYSLDVIISHDVMQKQEQARRLSEQNAELSARLLKSISFQGIQESVLGQGTGPTNLHVADEVLIAPEVPPVEILPFKPSKHHLPLLSGY
jgi:hypothetical protein